jgi:hypothetical protein
MLAPICIFKVLELAFWPILRSFCGCPWLVDWLWVKLTSQNCSLYRPTVHPRVIAMRIMVWWYWLGLTPNSSTRVLWQPPVLSGGPVSRDISGASRRMGERNEILVYLSLWDFKDLYHAIKSYNMGLPASHPTWRKVCGRFLSPLKIHCLGRVWSHGLWVQWQAH